MESRSRIFSILFVFTTSCYFFQFHSILPNPYQNDLHIPSASDSSDSSGRQSSRPRVIKKRIIENRIIEKILQNSYAHTSNSRTKELITISYNCQFCRKAKDTRLWLHVSCLYSKTVNTIFFFKMTIYYHNKLQLSILQESKRY